VVEDPALAAKYAANWQEHLKHSEPYRGKRSCPCARVMVRQSGIQFILTGH
jgi:hypothetical protein